MRIAYIIGLMSFTPPQHERNVAAQKLRIRILFIYLKQVIEISAICLVTNIAKTQSLFNRCDILYTQPDRNQGGRSAI